MSQSGSEPSWCERCRYATTTTCIRPRGPRSTHWTLRPNAVLAGYDQASASDRASGSEGSYEHVCGKDDPSYGYCGGCSICGLLLSRESSSEKNSR